MSTITRDLGPAERRAARASRSTPSSFGITRSIRITSGSSRSARSIASSPSAASPTISKPSWSSRNVRSPSRTTAWSSTIRMRIDQPSRATSSRTVVPAPGAERISQAPAELAGALLHRGQAEVPGAELGGVGIEPDPVVGHLDREPPSRRRRARTMTCSAPAWRSALWSASWAIRSTGQLALAGVQLQVGLELQLDARRRARGSSISTSLRSVPSSPSRSSSGGRRPRISARSSSSASSRQLAAGARAAPGRRSGPGRAGSRPPRRSASR